MDKKKIPKKGKIKKKGKGKGKPKAKKPTVSQVAKQSQNVRVNVNIPQSKQRRSSAPRQPSQPQLQPQTQIVYRNLNEPAINNMDPRNTSKPPVVAPPVAPPVAPTIATEIIPPAVVAMSVAPSSMRQIPFSSVSRVRHQTEFSDKSTVPSQISFGNSLRTNSAFTNNSPPNPLSPLTLPTFNDNTYVNSPPLSPLTPPSQSQQSSIVNFPNEINNPMLNNPPQKGPFGETNKDFSRLYNKWNVDAARAKTVDLGLKLVDKNGKTLNKKQLIDQMMRANENDLSVLFEPKRKRK